MEQGQLKYTDLADILLQSRESDYAAALDIARNDFKFEEGRLRTLASAFQEDGINVEGLDDYIKAKISEARRARRDVTSEPSYLFENDLLNKGDSLKGTLKTEANERKISQPIPGTEAHHPASVSSVESYLQNMSGDDVRETLRILESQGYTIGSKAEGFIPLSKPAHTTGGKNWGPNYAHVGVDGSPDSGRFKGQALPKGTTPEQAASALKPMLDEQIQLNTAAYNHPTEVAMRAAVEGEMGPIQWQKKPGESQTEQNSAAKAKGINATVISKTFDRNPGLIETGLIPNVDVMAAGGARIPRDLPKMPKKNLDLSNGTINFKPPVAAQPTPTPRPTPKPAPKVTSKPKPPPVKASSKPSAASRLKITGPAKSTLKLPTATRTRMAASQEIRRLANSTSDVLNIIPGEWRPSNLPGI